MALLMACVQVAAVSAPPADGATGAADATGTAGTAGAASAARVTPAAAALEHTIDLRVDLARSLGPARPLLAGSNVPWYHEAEGLIDPSLQLRPPMLALARQMAPTVLRYPGAPDTYHWRQGVGPLAQRPVVSSGDGRPKEQILLGTQEFLELCDELGAQPLIEINVHDGSDESLAAEAADWVRYVNRQGLTSKRTGRRLPAVRYWELGNEPYFMEKTREVAGAPGAPARTEANPHFLTPAQYTRRLNKIMAAMLAVDPDLRLGLPFATDTWSGRPWSMSNDEIGAVVGPQLGYARALLDGLDQPQRLGFLALHYYMPLLNDVRDKQGRRLPVPDDEALYWSAMAGSESVRQHLDVVRRTWREHPRTRAIAQPPLIVTEFNAFFTNRWDGGREAPANAYTATQAGALFAADLLRTLAQEPDVEAALQWSISRNWHFGAITFNEGATAFYGRPIFHTLQAFRRLLGEPGGMRRPVDVRVATTTRAQRGLGFVSAAPQLPLATALAVQQGRTLRLLVINKDPLRPAQVTLTLQDGARPLAAATAQVTLHSSGGASAFHAPGQPQALQIRTLTLRGPAAKDASRTAPATGDLPAWQLPPASMGWVTVTWR